MHTSKSFNDSKSTSSYYNTTISENRTNIMEAEGENEITFSDKSQSCCVCFVSMADPVGPIGELIQIKSENTTLFSSIQLLQ
jgi:hypothetical protein